MRKNNLPERVISFFLIFFLGIATAIGVAAGEEPPMKNADVMALVAAGLSESLITAKVRSARETAFDTSVSGLKLLKASGVSDEVIHAMLESATSSAGYSTSDDPAAMHQPGLYVQMAGRDGQAHLVMLQHAQSGGSKAGQSAMSSIGKGAAMTGFGGFGAGGGKTHVKAELNGPKSAIQLEDPNPTFYIYLLEDTQRFGGGDFSAHDFTLLKFRENAKTREVEIAAMSPYGFDATQNNALQDKVRQPTTTQRIKPGIYMVKLLRPLKPGEYAFEHLIDGVFYDFGVTGAGR
jgi:hypothetical protein